MVRGPTRAGPALLVRREMASRSARATRRATTSVVRPTPKLLGHLGDCRAGGVQQLGSFEIGGLVLAELAFHAFVFECDRDRPAVHAEVPGELLDVAHLRRRRPVRGSPLSSGVGAR